MTSISIVGTGFYVPTKTLTNKDLAKMVDTTEEWIFEKVGVKERHIADQTEATSDLALFAALDALRDAKVHSDDIDLIVLATSSPDMIQPSTAAILQGKLGAINSAAFDVGAVCAGFVYALSVAYSMLIANKSYKKALVVGAETYSRIMDWKDRNTCVFFGDGAGAVILSKTNTPYGIKNYFIKNDGRGASVIKFMAGGSRYPASSETLEKNMHKFEMQGKLVWDFATEFCPFAVRNVMSLAHKEVADIDFLISHQANINIIKNCMASLNLPMDKTYANLDRYGNTSGASIPIALAEADDRGLLKKGDNIVFVGFGGGLSYGAVYLTWAK